MRISDWSSDVCSSDLKQQAYPTFEWLIVDDGSNDDTRDLVDCFKAEGKINIRYFFQQNSGKHVAINRGVEEAKGTLFFIVDSDDFLTTDSLHLINEAWQKLYHENYGEGFAGICGLRCFQDGTVIGGDVDYQVLDISMLEYRYQSGYKGDKAEVYLTEVLASYPFPNIDEIGREHV